MPFAAFEEFDKDLAEIMSDLKRGKRGLGRNVSMPGASSALRALYQPQPDPWAAGNSWNHWQQDAYEPPAAGSAAKRHGVFQTSEGLAWGKGPGAVQTTLVNGKTFDLSAGCI